MGFSSSSLISPCDFHVILCNGGYKVAIPVNIFFFILNNIVNNPDNPDNPDNLHNDFFFIF